MFGAVQAIEAECPGYRITPEMEGSMGMMGQLAERADSTKDIVVRIMLAMAEMGSRYNLKGDPSGFCKRILADYGPASPNPVVQRTRKR